MDNAVKYGAIIVLIAAIIGAVVYLNYTSQPSNPGEETSKGTSTPTTTSTTSSFTGYITVVDDLNRTVKIKANPERIVTTIRIVSSFILQFNVKDKLVGIDSAMLDNQFYLKCCPWLKNVTIVATGKRNINLEQILALKPDVVFAKNYQRNLLSGIESQVPIVYLDLETPDIFMHDLELVGKILGQEDRAQELKNYYMQLLGLVENKTKNLGDEEKPVTLFIYYSNGKFKVPPTHWLQYHMIKLAGGKPPAIQGTGWIEVNVEQIIEWNPDIIFVVNYRGDTIQAVNDLLNNPLLTGINAIRNHRVYPIPSDGEPWDMPTPKWILCTVYMAVRIHPELFSDVNLTSITIEFYMKVYGMSQSDAETLVPDTIRG